MKKNNYYKLLFCFLYIQVYGQVTADELVVLKNVATTVSMNAISNPVLGSLVYNTENEGVYEYDGTNWKFSYFIHTPYITNRVAETITINQTKTIVLNGSDFLPTTTVVISGFGGIINTTTIVSPVRIELNITADATTGFYDIIITNNGLANTSWVGNGTNKLQITN